MAPTTIDIDEAACRAVIMRYQLATKRQAVNLALRTLAAEPLPAAALGALRGSAWEEIAVHAIAASPVRGNATADDRIAPPEPSKVS